MTDPLNIVPKVIDASHYDDLQDIQKVKGAGIRGWVNKASEGAGSIDATFAIRRPVVLGAGVLYGAYHFLRPGDMVQQAGHFLNAVHDPAGLCLMADWEVQGIPPPDLKTWLGTIHDKTGQWPVVYSYTSLLLDQLARLGRDTVLSQCRLWIAKYSAIGAGQTPWPTQIWARPWLWQFTGDGNGPGIHQIPGIVLPGSRGIDVNAYEGGDLHGSDHSDDDLRAEWTGGAATAPSTAPAPVYPPPATMTRQTGITATVFGGVSDHERDAYDGHVITDAELGVSLPAIVHPRREVRVINGAKSVVAGLVDVGPWNTNDPYWMKGARPQAESGTDMRGRRTNRAGIDLTPATARAIGIDGLGKVDWEWAD